MNKTTLYEFLTACMEMLYIYVNMKKTPVPESLRSFAGVHIVETGKPMDMNTISIGRIRITLSLVVKSIDDRSEVTPAILIDGVVIELSQFLRLLGRVSGAESVSVEEWEISLADWVIHHVYPENTGE